MQAHTGTLISGSNALQFLDRTFYEGSDLDLYVDNINREEVGSYLQSVGYSFKPSNTQSPPFTGVAYRRSGRTEIVDPSDDIEIYGMRGVAGVFNFIKEGSPERKIQLITASHSPLEIILNFHSSESKGPF
jgi:hypothetical protein